MASVPISLIFDIQSGSVGVAFISHERTMPKVLWNTRVSFPVSKDVTISDLQIHTVRTLKKVTKEAVKHLPKEPLHSIFCFYGAPWHISKPVTTTLHRETTFTVTKKLLEALIRKEEEIFISRQNKAKLIGSNITKISLNGYEVSNPYQKNVKKLSCSLLMSAIAEQFVADIESVIHQHIRVIEIRHNVLPLAIASVIRDIMPHDSSFVSIVVGEEITEVSVVKQGELANTVTFPAGKHTAFRPLANTHSPAVTLSLIRLHANKKHTPEWKSSVIKHIETARSIWSDYLSKALTELSVHLPLPKTVLVMSDIDSRLLFAKHLGEVKLDIGKGFRERINPVFLHEDLLKDFIGSHFFHAPDIFLGAEGFFAHRLLKDSGVVV